MTDSPWLTPAEVAELTDKVKWSAQCRTLAKMGVKFKPNAVGRPLVERALVLSKPSAQTKAKEPNWGQLRGQEAA